MLRTSFLFMAVALLCLFVLVGVASADSLYTVQPGDTLASIARRYDSDINTIAQANNIINPSFIYVGQALTIPDGTAPAEPTNPQPEAPAPAPTGNVTHIVQPGETIAVLSRAYGVTISAIIQANQLANPNYVYPGQSLIIPIAGSPAPAPAPTEVPPAPTTAPPAEATPVPNPPAPEPEPGPLPPVAPITHIVQRGDTIAAIGRQYSVSAEAIVRFNGLVNANLIYVGQVLTIPAGGDGVPNPPPAPTESAPPAEPTAEPVEPIVEPTPIAPTPTPEPVETPIPTVPTGANLFNNPSFEGGHYNLNGLAELQVPNSWQLGWLEGPNDFGGEDFRPETRVLSGVFLPPNERPMFIFDGWHTFKIFKGYGAISVQLSTDVALQPGTYEFEASVYPDQVVSYTNGKKIFASGDASEIRMSASNGADSGWMFPSVGEKNVLTHRVIVDSAETVTFTISVRGRYGLLNNGFFIDNLRLREMQ